MTDQFKSGLRSRMSDGVQVNELTLDQPQRTATELKPPPTRHKGLKQYALMLAFFLYFTSACIILHGLQIIGSPLYLINRDYYYACMSLSKQGFGLVVNTVMQWFNPTVMRISGDESVKKELRKTKDGRLECEFPERMVLVANHQIYTDWLYLWWISYTARMHGHIYIILKESLQYIPVLGPGMLFFSFVFLARNWEKDKPRLQRGIGKLKTRHTGPMSGSNSLDPMWLMLFPEGTNVSTNGRKSSKRWAEKTGIQDMQHCLLPRSTGSFFILNELKSSVDWIYDCTVAYEGIPRGEYGQDIFQLKSMFFQGRNPKSINFHWRKIAISSIPLGDIEEFHAWLIGRWREKDDLLEYYAQNARFPAYRDAVVVEPEAETKTTTNAGYIETEVRCVSSFEFLLIFTPLLLEIPIIYALVWLYRSLF